jgi:hypothetical protein
MEKVGTWDGSTLFVTSDHWWRTHSIWRNANWARLPEFTWTAQETAYIDADQDKRVPFIAKLPGQNRSVTYTEEFNTLLVHNLILETLKGEIKTHEELKTWLDIHRNDVAVHAYANVVGH